MKKWLLALLAALALGLVGIYVWIPSPVKIREVTAVAASEKGIVPFISDTAGIARWWPMAAGGQFSYNGTHYRVGKPLVNGLELKLAQGGDTLLTLLHALAYRKDSAEVVWTASLPASNNPIERIRNYRRGLALKADMEAILQKLQNFAAKMENIYGIAVKQTKVQDTLLIAREHNGTGLPSQPLVYDMIAKTTQYLQQQGATITNPPMLSIYTEDSLHYRTMVALPIDKEIPVTAGFTIRRMFAGNILVTEVKGGPATVARAFAQLNQYHNANDMTSPAKPFQSLVTDRQAEADTGKWVTRIFWPVF
jgi:DNA-directed RNA polymerase subunit L